MKYDDDDKHDNPHGGPGIIISLGMSPPKGKKGKKGKDEAKARKSIAKGKLQKELKKMYASWKPDKGNEQAVAYNDELGAFIEGMEE